MNQETEGLLSPWIRDIRLKRVAAFIKPKSTVLDLACGNGYLADFLPTGCQYYGVDRLEPTSLSRFSDFQKQDLLDENIASLVEQWLPRKPDYITSVAFLEHIANPGRFIERFIRLLGEDGAFIGTTPHPRGRKVHDYLAKIGICSRSGAKEHEAFLGREELARAAEAANGQLMTYEQFLVGLNQVFTIR